MEMTFPVLVRMTYEPGTKDVHQAEMCFYIKSEHQEKPPNPKSKQIYIDKLPDMDVYAR